MKLLREVITHSAFAVSLFVRKKKQVTNNKKLLNSYICCSGCPNYCNCLFLFSGRLGKGRGGLRLTT